MRHGEHQSNLEGSSQGGQGNLFFQKFLPEPESK